MTAVVGSSGMAGASEERSGSGQSIHLVSTRPSQEECGAGSGHRPDRIAGRVAIGVTINVVCSTRRSSSLRHEHRSLTMKILMVLTSHDKLGNTGRKTG